MEPTALIAEDEPLLRDALVRELKGAWPELKVVARARNGREAILLFEEHRPTVCFLDVRMPGLSGIDVARHIGRRAHLVFVTAYDEYAVAAFAHGVMDYIVKPVDAARLAETIHRVKERLRLSEPATNVEEALRELAERLAAPSSDGSSAPLRWLRAQAGRTVRLIAVEDIEYLRSDTKYTRIAWRDGGACAEALVRTPLKELAARLDSAQFAQVHRSVVVNLAAISHVERGDRDHAEIHLRGRAEVLPVSRRYLHLFRQNVTADAPAVASRRSPPCGLCPWGASARRSRPRTCRSSADAAGRPSDSAVGRSFSAWSCASPIL